MPNFDNILDFYLSDYSRTLFPMETNRIIITAAVTDIADFIYKKILKDKTHHFLQQTRVYASKPRMHLRRTVKLDPIAEFFIYDLVYRNRQSFRGDFNIKCNNYGFRFQSGKLISPRASYRNFKKAVSAAIATYKFGVKFDISSYFNSIYHHDLVAWFNDGTRSEDDVMAFDIFLKQTNSGRSIDCLPQGIAPCKVIGSHYLKFVDNTNRLKSDILLRFMDDFHLFSSDEETVIEDFAFIQRLLGEKGLSVNPNKTRIGDVEHIDIERELDEIRLELLRARRSILEAYDEGLGLLREETETEDEEETDLDEEVEVEPEEVEQSEEKMVLNEEQVEYLLSLLKTEDIEEEDAELILTLMGDYSSDVEAYIPLFLDRFPNLSKNIFHFFQYVDDMGSIAEQIHAFLKNKGYVTEYQLFWLATIAENYLLKTGRIGDILLLLYEHPNASVISKAKVLEIPEHRFGMGDLREEHLRTGESDWLAWAAAVGCRKVKKANRNHLLSYFSHGSPLNQLIANCVTNL